MDRTGSVDAAYRRLQKAQYDLIKAMIFEARAQIATDEVCPSD